MHCACQRMTGPDLAYEGHNIIKTGELEYSRLRGSAQTSTLLPDADNAAVGSHDKKIFCRRHQMSPVFLLYRKLFVSYKVKKAPRGCASRGEEVCCKQHRSSAKESQATLCYIIGNFLFSLLD